MKLKNKIAIVTGAARGIGKACADRLAADGATVVRADIAEGAEIFISDVSQKSGIDALVAHALARHGRIDILVNNAGISRGGDMLDVTEADYDAVMNLNARGAFFMAQACAREMVKQGGGGAIINMSSVNAELAIPTILAYCMSKGAVKQMTAVMAIALAPHNIRVNAIGPGSIMTDMLKGVVNDKAAMHRALSRTPLGRVGEASEIASIASFLASEDASYVTGQTIYADGGRMPLNYTVPVKD
jgi:glucose 1-dehydrogenase